MGSSSRELETPGEPGSDMPVSLRSRMLRGPPIGRKWSPLRRSAAARDSAIGSGRPSATVKNSQTFAVFHCTSPLKQLQRLCSCNPPPAGLHRQEAHPSRRAVMVTMNAIARSASLCQQVRRWGLTRALSAAVQRPGRGVPAVSVRAAGSHRPQCLQEPAPG